jgi:hypothetical protein
MKIVRFFSALWYQIGVANDRPNQKTANSKKKKKRLWIKISQKNKTNLNRFRLLLIFAVQYNPFPHFKSSFFCSWIRTFLVKGNPIYCKVRPLNFLKDQQKKFVRALLNILLENWFIHEREKLFDCNI